MGCPREHGLTGRCKKPGGRVLETERPKLDVASSVVGTVLGVKGTTRKRLGESCLKWSKTEKTSNQTIQCLNLLPATLPFTTGDIFHYRIYALEGFPKQAVGFLQSHLTIHGFLSSGGHDPPLILRQHGSEACTGFWNRKCSLKLSGRRQQINVSLFSCRELIQHCSLP